MSRIAARFFTNRAAIDLPVFGTNMRPCSGPDSTSSHRRRPDGDGSRTSSRAPVRHGDVMSGSCGSESAMRGAAGARPHDAVLILTATVRMPLAQLSGPEPYLQGFRGAVLGATRTPAPDRRPISGTTRPGASDPRGFRLLLWSGSSSSGRSAPTRAGRHAPVAMHDG